MNESQGGARPYDPIRVLLVDDHPVVRAGLGLLLSAAPDLDVIGEAETAAEALTLAQTLDPDVVLCDLRLGDGVDGVGVAAALSGRDAPAVLILTTYDHDRDIVRAVEAGAAGYLLKDAAPQVIIDAIRATAAGETVLSADQTERVVATMRTSRRRIFTSMQEVKARRRGTSRVSSKNQVTIPTDALRAAGIEVGERLVAHADGPGRVVFEREVDVLIKAGAGLSNREIAKALLVSEATVKTHLAHINDKLGTTSRTAAFAAARDLGLLSREP